VARDLLEGHACDVSCGLAQRPPDAWIHLPGAVTHLVRCHFERGGHTVEPARERSERAIAPGAHPVDDGPHLTVNGAMVSGIVRQQALDGASVARVDDSHTPHLALPPACGLRCSIGQSVMLNPHVEISDPLFVPCM
jgi:hypothetical protein